MKGSFTVELSLVFPVILLILVIFMQFGLYFMYRVYTLNAVNQSLSICSRSRQEKKTAEEAAQSAEAYLLDALAQLPIEIIELQCETTMGWFKEEYTVKVTAEYSFIFKFSWTAVEKSCVMNPVQFRNRCDFIWEKGKQYLDRFQNRTVEGEG